ncbi:hypothetical protein GE09DRAFT_1215050 [Coniochaeta sp. 2T2.1]|nr:hypothetical protein GE09DRAFT_1215050 [Coniochaeta sp. 2T2.1]
MPSLILKAATIAACLLAMTNPADAQQKWQLIEYSGHQNGATCSIQDLLNIRSGSELAPAAVTAHATDKVRGTG